VSTTPLSLLIDADDVSVDLFDDTLRALRGLLHEMDREASGQSEPSLRWLISEMAVGGSASLTLEAEAKDGFGDVGPNVLSALFSGLEAIEATAPLPDIYTPAAIDHLLDLVNLTGPDVRGFRLSSPLVPRVAIITPTTAILAQAFAAKSDRSFGAAEGTIEAVNVHGRPTFTVYDAVTKRAVSCELPEGRLADVVRGLEQKARVLVVGKRTRFPNRPDRVQDVTELRFLRNGVADIGSFIGILGQATEDPMEELRRTRDG
jgi:hypothetical protein